MSSSPKADKIMGAFFDRARTSFLATFDQMNAGIRDLKGHLAEIEPSTTPAPPISADRYHPAEPSETERLMAERFPGYEFQPNLTIQHLDGVEWHDAPLPPVNHECWAQSVRYDIFGLVDFQRCACGAANYGRVWIERNSERGPRG